MFKSEKSLIAALKNPSQKERAFSALVTQYKERLYWHIRRMVWLHEDADDALQNTFIKVYRNISHFKEASKLYTWLYRIATNETLSLLAKKAKQKHISIETLTQQTLSQLQDDVYFDGNTIQLKLQKAIAKLPERQRLIFNMKYFEDLTFSELSDILDTSVGGLKSSYHHAVKKIKLELSQFETFLEKTHQTNNGN